MGSLTDAEDVLQEALLAAWTVVGAEVAIRVGDIDAGAGCRVP